MDALSGAPLNTSSAESSACIVAMIERTGVAVEAMEIRELG